MTRHDFRRIVLALAVIGCVCFWIAAYKVLTA